MEPRVLILDDDRKLCALLEEYLSDHGMDVFSLHHPDGLSEEIKRRRPNILILDIMLPGGQDGFEILKAIRTTHSLPTIMLSARGDETDRIVGLEVGADDYLPKPFNPRELLARVKAVMRRTTSDEKPEHPPQLRAGGLELDVRLGVLKSEDARLELTEAESRLLSAFMAHPDRVLTRDEIMNLTHGRDTMAYERTIDVHVAKLRSILSRISGAPVIQTVRGKGYMFVSDAHL